MIALGYSYVYKARLLGCLAVQCCKVAAQSGLVGMRYALRGCGRLHLLFSIFKHCCMPVRMVLLVGLPSVSIVDEALSMIMLCYVTSS